ncbi:MAG: virulence-associated E family protein [Eubacteriales bacterium]|nr:virulence-associated E family protein [Eubacteriales bacterium]
MRNLSIAYGNNRQAKTWVNKTIQFDDLKERLKTTIRTTESAEEYAKMSRAQRDAAKDHGGFVAGVLKGGRRKIDTVEVRSMLALDGDRIDRTFLDNYESICPYTSALYTTHSSTDDNPRVRLVIPLTRDVTPEEFVAVSRYLADMLGIDYFDECSYQPNQLMYWPSTPANGTFVYKETDGGWLDPDDILSKHPEWTDPTRLPTSSRESKANTVAQQKVQDPLAKEGVVGLFNRTYYPITKALEAFLSDVYEPTDNENRWHLITSGSMAGVEIKEDKFIYSHHAKDPAYLKLCNAFDIVRTHRFGDMDDKASYKAMCDFAMQQDDVKMLAAAEKMADAQTDFTDGEDSDWMKKLQYEPRSTVLKNNLHNITLILQNDPLLQNIVFNQQLDGMEIKGAVPWQHPSKYWRDADDAQLISYVDSHYGTFSQRNYQIAVTKVSDDRSYHPIREYLDALPEWDKIPRVDTLLIDYLGAEDNAYVRAVTRKTLCAAVRRVQEPGVKFDTMLVLNGPQGIGKSTLISRLAGEWFSDSLNLGDTKDKTAAEKLQGYWILEIGELAGLRKAEVETLRSFLSRQNDIYRAAFGRRATPHPRQCIFFGTTNAESGYLRDTTGNRRFWPVKTPGGGSKHSWDITTEEIEQIWAEVLVYVKAGEKLHLAADIESLAKEEQREALESDEREGLVRDFLETLLPENWDSMDLFERRSFLSGVSNIGAKGTVRRTRVCNMEIWCELFGKDQGNLGRAESNTLAAMLTKLGWIRQEKKERVKLYGPQVVFVPDNVPD